MRADQWGDFQTPPELAAAVMATLDDGWNRLLEPTCGLGSFLAAGEEVDIEERVGVEVNTEYASVAGAAATVVLRASIFDLDLARDLPWNSTGPLLVVGNPPWVTASQLGRLDSTNLPPKSNLRNLRGIEAMTGASNFDIAEFILLKVASELRSERPTVAMLVKTQVARNVLEFAHRSNLELDGASIRRIDAKKWFGASVDACLFTFRIGHGTDLRTPVFESLTADRPQQVIGFAAGRMVADLEAYVRSSFADGICQLEWRQGVKHDAAAVMELQRSDDGSFQNGSLEAVEIETEWAYPLLKSTDVFHGRSPSTRHVVVTQRNLASNTLSLEQDAPLLWAYLSANSERLARRKSSIYKNRAAFSMFGIGDYTFTPWKVAVSGLHKEIRFRLVGPSEGRPVLFDDTCYLLPFDKATDAALATALYESPAARDLLLALSFPDAKRPVTKKLLARLDLAALASKADADEIRAVASALLGTPVSQSDWEQFTDSLRPPERAVTQTSLSLAL